MLINYKQLAKELHMSHKTIRKYWKYWPHILVGPDATLRYARFDLDQVKNHMQSQAEKLKN